MNDSSLLKDMQISRNGSYAGGNGHSHSVTSARDGYREFIPGEKKAALRPPQKNRIKRC